MTGPRVDTAPRPLTRILSPDEFDQMQALPPGAKNVDPKGMTNGPTRVLMPDEFDAAQAMSGPAVKALQLPSLPKIAPRDATATRMDNRTKGTRQTGVAGVVGNMVNPILEHPFMTAGVIGATAIPVVGPYIGAAMMGDMASNVALYGYQKHLETVATPGARQIMEADPGRISGEAAIAQAAMLLMPFAAHVGIKAFRGPEIGAGMVEAGATGVRALTEPQAEALGGAASLHGLPETANPYPPDSPLARRWQDGHANTPPPPTLPEPIESPIASAHTGGDAISSPVDPVQAAADARMLAAQVPKGEPGVRVEPSPSGNIQKVTARDENGEGIGVLSLVKNESGGYDVLAVHVAEGSRRQGIATELYDAADAAGLTVESGKSGLTEEGRAFTEARAVAPAEGSRLTPIEGTGEVKTRGLSAGVQEQALANKLADTLGELPEYRTMDVADQARRATELLASDAARARRVALGEEAAPHGLHPEAVFKAVEDRATIEGDVGTLRDLATGKLTEEGTTMGQRLRLLAERDPESPVAAIQNVIDVWKRAVTNVPKARAAVLKAMREMIAEAAEKKPARIKDWSTFVESLKC